MQTLLRRCQRSSASSGCDWPMTDDNRKLDTLVNSTAFVHVTREESWKWQAGWGSIQREGSLNLTVWRSLSSKIVLSRVSRRNHLRAASRRLCYPRGTNSRDRFTSVTHLDSNAPRSILRYRLDNIMIGPTDDDLLHDKHAVKSRREWRKQIFAWSKDVHMRNIKSTRVHIPQIYKSMSAVNCYL